MKQSCADDRLLSFSSILAKHFFAVKSEGMFQATAYKTANTKDSGSGFCCQHKFICELVHENELKPQREPNFQTVSLIISYFILNI